MAKKPVKRPVRKTVKRAAPTPEPAAPVIERVPPRNEFEARRYQLMDEKKSLIDNVTRESKSGYGPKAQAAQAAADKRGSQIDAELKTLSRDERLADPVNRTLVLGAKLALPVVGMMAGHSMAAKITAQHLKVTSKRASELKKLATEINALAGSGKNLKNPLVQAKLASFAKAVANSDLTKLKGPTGYQRSLFLFADAAIAYGIAKNVDDPVIQELGKAVASGFVLAGSSLVAERVINNRLMPPVPALADSAVEMAKTVATKAGLKELQAVNEASSVLQAAKSLPKPKANPAKVITPPVAQKAAKAAKPAAKTSAATKTLAKVAKASPEAAAKAAQMSFPFMKAARAASRAIVPLAAGLAAAAAFSKSSQAGESSAQSGVKAGVAALDSVLTLGTATAIAEAVAKRAKIAYDPRVAAQKAQAAEASRIIAKGGKPTPAQMMALSNQQRADAGAQAAAQRIETARKHNGTQAQIKDQPGTGDIRVKGHVSRSERGRIFWVKPHTRSR